MSSEPKTPVDGIIAHSAILACELPAEVVAAMDTSQERFDQYCRRVPEEEISPTMEIFVPCYQAINDAQGTPDFGKPCEYCNAPEVNGERRLIAFTSHERAMQFIEHKLGLTAVLDHLGVPTYIQPMMLAMGVATYGFMHMVLDGYTTFRVAREIGFDVAKQAHQFQRRQRRGRAR